MSSGDKKSKEYNINDKNLHAYSQCNKKINLTSLNLIIHNIYNIIPKNKKHTHTHIHKYKKINLIQVLFIYLFVCLQ